MKVYISGPITGIDRAVYLSQFAEAEKRLREKGYEVLNPTKLPPSRWLWIYRLLGYRLTLLYDIWHLFGCDGILLLDGWEPHLELCLQMAQRKSGREAPNMYVYGGGKAIERWCQEHGLRYLDEYMNIKKKQINNYGKQD